MLCVNMGTSEVLMHSKYIYTEREGTDKTQVLMHTVPLYYMLLSYD